MAQGRTVRTPEKGERLLAKLCLGYSVSAACKAEGIGRTSYYAWLIDDPEFAKAAEQAIEAGTDLLEDEAKRRAVGPMGSDTLLIFLLKARRPAVYREKFAHEMTGPNGLPLTIMFAERSDGPS